MFEKYETILEKVDPIKYSGVVKKVQGLIIESLGPQVVIGELCHILISKGGSPIRAEVVGFHNEIVQLMPFDDMEGIEPGCAVVAMGEYLTVSVSGKLLGRVLDSMGHPLDEKGSIGSAENFPVNNIPPDVLKRKAIKHRLVTGVRAIDAMTPVGMGQRIGIFSGSGVGKSTLLGMIARNTHADINVIALIGERGREVKEFLESDLGEEGLSRSVIIVSTSDSPPLSRVKAAFVATAVAEYFRDQGKNVMLLFDSLTRFARAQREIGLAIGEPPATRGFTPSVFSLLPKLLERCGTSEKGTITGFYTILVDGADMHEPVADNVRGILDGHIVLSRKLAQSYHYPAIDVLQSLSRLGNKITGNEEQVAMGRIRTLLASYTEAEDLINVGAYSDGSNKDIDEAIKKIDLIRKFLRQRITENAEISKTLELAVEISGIEIPRDMVEESAGETVSI
ncbi:MAG: flagellum-specific ATP synthase FliI [Spirochaetes bacterium]|nr:MAG: flagellum-specific ATP synthase FliI [Spirochaetota bacterium]